MEVRDKKTNKVAFGYFVNAVRNDTNFIYSQISQKADTIINKTYRSYKITTGTDSTITKYLCTKKGLKLYNVQRFWNGTVVENTMFNIFVVRF